MSAVYRALKGLLHREVALGLTPLQKWLFYEIFYIFLPPSPKQFQNVFSCTHLAIYQLLIYRTFLCIADTYDLFLAYTYKGLLYIKGPLSIKHLVKKPSVYSILSKWLSTNKQTNKQIEHIEVFIDIFCGKICRSSQRHSIDLLQKYL